MFDASIPVQLAFYALVEHGEMNRLSRVDVLFLIAALRKRVGMTKSYHITVPLYYVINVLVVRNIFLFSGGGGGIFTCIFFFFFLSFSPS